MRIKPFALRQRKIAFLLTCPQWWGPEHHSKLTQAMRRAGLYSASTHEQDICSGLPRLIKSARAVGPAGGPVPGEARPPEVCGHKNWAIRGYNRIGSGQCLDCGQEVGLCELFNALREEVIATSQAIAVPISYLPPRADSADTAHLA